MNKPNEILVWSKPVRLLHWALPLLVGLAWFSTESEALEDAHPYIGFAVVAVLVIRLLLGVVSRDQYTRFSSWSFSIKGALDYLKGLLAGTSPRYIGHNPAGSVMAAGLLGVLGLQCLTGFLWWTARGHGPLAEVLVLKPYKGLLHESHEVLFNLLIVMIILHIAGAVISGLKHGENLGRAMVTGYKRKD